MIKLKKSKKNKGNGLYDKTVNFLFKPDVPLKDGEKHAILWDSKKKKLTPGNYVGPGTDILSKVKNKVPAITPTDLISKRHDIQYSLSNNIDGIKSADDIMVESLKKARKLGKENAFNSYPAQIGIEANRWLGRVLPSKYYDKFVNYMTGYNDFRKGLSLEDRLLLQEELKKVDKEIKEQGYGKKKRKLNNKKLKTNLKTLH